MAKLESKLHENLEQPPKLTCQRPNVAFNFSCFKKASKKANNRTSEQEAIPTTRVVHEKKEENVSKTKNIKCLKLKASEFLFVDDDDEDEKYIREPKV